MNIFKYIVGYFKKIRSRFRKSSRNKEVIQRIEENKNKKLKEVDEKLQTLSTQEDNKEQVKQAIEEKTSIEIGQELTQEIRELVFNLAEIENEVKLFNQKLFEIDVQKQNISGIQVSQNLESDKAFDRLEKLLKEISNENKIQCNTDIFKGFDENKAEVDSFFQEFRLIKIYRKREEEREREEQVKRQKVNAILSKIDHALNYETLDQAKQSIRIAERAILGLGSSQQKTDFQKRLTSLVQVFRKKEIEVEAERQRKKLERERKEAELKRKEKEKSREEELKQKKAEEEKRRKKEQELRDKENKRKKQLQKLLTKKPDWEEFRSVLQENGITIFYHFTDRVNIESIKKNGGLFSWYYCDNNRITVLMPGGSTQSRLNDTTNNKKDFVRLALNKEHPMLWIAQNESRITKPIWLEVKVDVAFFVETEFADKNAAAFRSYTPKIGKTISHLKNIRFDILKKAEQIKHYNLSEEERAYNQAEILVKTWIPLEYITNINQF